MKNYYGDVYVLQKVRLRIDLNSAKKPTKESVLKQIRDEDYGDILDTEEIETLEVYKLNLEDQGPAEVEDDEEETEEE